MNAVDKLPIRDRYKISAASVSILSVVALSACANYETTAQSPTRGNLQVASTPTTEDIKECLETTKEVDFIYAMGFAGQEINDYIADKDYARTERFMNGMNENFTTEEPIVIAASFGVRNLDPQDVIAKSIELTDLTIDTAKDHGFSNLIPLYETYDAGQDDIATVRAIRLNADVCAKDDKIAKIPIDTDISL